MRRKKYRITFFTTSLMTDCQIVCNKCIKTNFPNSEHIVIQGTSGWFSVWYEWLNRAKDIDSDYYIYVDEDCFIKDSKYIYDTIENMEKNGYDIAGCPDGGYEYRHANPFALNSFFMILNRKCIDTWFKYKDNIPQFKKEWIDYNQFNNLTLDDTQFTYIYDMEFGSSGKNVLEIYKEGSEPYYDFMWVLKDNGIRFLYLQPSLDEKYMTTNLLNDSIVHMWYMRNRSSNKIVSELHKISNKERFDGIINEINKKLSYTMIVIHVVIMNDFDIVLKHIIDTIDESGLYKECDQIILSVVGNSDELIKVDDYITSHKKILIFTQDKDIRVCEFPTLKLVKSLSNEFKGKYLYLHTKGVSQTDKKKKKAENGWLDYMLEYNVYRYKECLDKLDDYDTVGVQLSGDKEVFAKYKYLDFYKYIDGKIIEPLFYGGNFMWLRSEYIDRLPNIYNVIFGVINNGNPINLSYELMLKLRPLPEYYLTSLSDIKAYNIHTIPISANLLTYNFNKSDYENRKKNIIVIHVPIMNNWRTCFKAVAKRINISGLYNFVDRIVISVTGKTDNIDTLEEYVEKHDKVVIFKTADTIDYCEFPTIQLLHEMAQKIDANFLYLHMKGISRMNLWEQESAWRDFMLYFCVDKWKNNIELLKEYDTVGCNMKGEYKYFNEQLSYKFGIDSNKLPKCYAGNFWWTTSDYLRKLPNIKNIIPVEEYYSMPSYNVMYRKYRMLCEMYILSNPDVKCYNYLTTDKDLYREKILPEEYENVII